MTIEQMKVEFSKLPMAEKLLLVEEMWDSIADGDHALPMPSWQQTELDKRYQEYQEGRIESREWQSVHESIRDKYK